jgi:hypothetical protein
LPLQSPHRRFLDRLGVIPAADVERAVDGEEEQFLGGVQRTSPV